MIDHSIRLKVAAIEAESVASLSQFLSRHLPQEGVAVIVQSRIKSHGSVEGKLQRRRLMQQNLASGGSRGDFVNDFLGIRVVVPHIGQLKQAAELLTEWVAAYEQFGLISIVDYFQNSAEKFYRSYHMDLRFDRDASLRDKVGVEIQLTTYLQNFFNEFSHTFSYRKIAREPGVNKLLGRLARDLHQLDDDVAGLFSRSTDKSD